MPLDWFSLSHLALACLCLSPKSGIFLIAGTDKCHGRFWPQIGDWLYHIKLLQKKGQFHKLYMRALFRPAGGWVIFFCIIQLCWIMQKMGLLIWNYSAWQFYNMAQCFVLGHIVKMAGRWHKWVGVKPSLRDCFVHTRLCSKVSYVQAGIDELDIELKA